MMTFTLNNLSAVRRLLTHHNCNNTRHYKLWRSIKYNCSNRSVHTSQTASQLNYKNKLSLLNKNTRSFIRIDRLLSNDFSITWKKKAIRSKKTETAEREKVSHLVIDKNIAEECVKMNLENIEIKSILMCLNNNKEIEDLAFKQGMDKNTLLQSFISFRRLCFEAKLLPTDLYFIIEGLKNNSYTALDVFPYLLKQAHKIFPHLLAIEELKEISDMTAPHQKYQFARQKQRKIIFHSGPTNSGKTYHAMKRFLEVDSAVYCSPLRLLAMEVYHKSNSAGVPCDLITGEERRSGHLDEAYSHVLSESREQQASHLACTAEMIQLENEFDIAIIDEIQTIRSKSRGWAWTRALLGLNCQEIHVCGETSAIDIVKKIASKCGDEFHLEEYNRLTDLEVEDTPLTSLEDLRSGDCIVCFSRNKIMELSREVQNLGHEVAIIYGNLPPATKIDMANRFNDPNNPCNIMIATDAIGMGLNLCIGRIIFDAFKTCTTFDGMSNVEEVDVSSVLQIAGRAGRYGTQWEKGYVTARSNEDLNVLKEVIKLKPQSIKQAGIQPELELYELFAYYMPDYSFQQLLDISKHLCKIDESLYFFSNNDNLKIISEKLQHIPLDIRQRYTLSYSPISTTQLFENQMFLKYARHIAEQQRLTIGWLCDEVKWPLSPPVTSNQLHHIESIYNVLELYCWLSYNYPHLFTDIEEVRQMKITLENTIKAAVRNYPELKENINQDTLSSSLNDSDTSNFDKNSPLRSDKQGADEACKQSEAQPNTSNTSHGTKASERLLKMGLVTPVILQQLKEEWKVNTQVTVDDDGSDEVFPVESVSHDAGSDVPPQPVVHDNNIIIKESTTTHINEEEHISESRKLIYELCRHSCNKPTFTIQQKISDGHTVYTCSIHAAKYKAEGEGRSIHEAEKDAVDLLMQMMEVETWSLFNKADKHNNNIRTIDENSSVTSTEEIYKIYRVMRGLSTTDDHITPKTCLAQVYELCAKAKEDKPKIELILAEPFPDNSWNFKFSVQVGKYNGIGEGPTKKSARERASASILNIIEKDCSTLYNNQRTSTIKNLRNRDSLPSDSMHTENLEGDTVPTNYSSDNHSYSICQAMIKLKQRYNASINQVNDNPISNLTVLCAKAKVKPPKFSHINTVLQNKQYHYTYSVSAVHLSANGEGSSKTKAKLAAAQALLDTIEKDALLDTSPVSRIESGAVEYSCYE